MKYRILEQWTESGKITYVPQVRCGWWIFKYWNTFHHQKFAELGIFPPMGINIPASFDSYTKAKQFIDRYKTQIETVKQNILFA